ncbi:cellulose biosynthesis protein BcsD [Rhodovastum atsumiense]|uniref:cellulose biosynthesis protein BcsD n=1 Tax=Rhodovastum atsumiense TaxID=504468 RepID=UPI00139F2BA8|nr:cellulose biosynthesis protein BcsD [Rhodovastum atsumiense]
MSLFLRAFAAEIDAQAGVAGRDALLRTVGRKMAQLAPLAPVSSLEALEAEMNGVLAGIRWGRTRVTLHEAERAVIFTHAGLPGVGGAGEPPGMWLAAALEGLYETWMGSQPGADPAMKARRVTGGTADGLVIRYTRGSAG